MKSVLLVNPPITVRADAPRIVYPPLGLGYIAATLRMGNFDVTLLDCIMESDMREVPVGPHHVRIGLSSEEIENRVAYFAPTLVAVTCMAADQAANAHMVAEAVKRLRGRKSMDISVAVGGGYASTQPELVMADYNVDFAIMGEGETPMFNLCMAQRNRRPPVNVDGVAYRDEWGSPVINKEQTTFPDLDQIPVPSRDLMKMVRYCLLPSYYFEAMTPHTTMVLSRGCPSQCAFCSVPRCFGSKYRKRSVDRILEELGALREEFGLREVEFVGDNLFHDREWAHGWMSAIARKHSDLNWSPVTGQSLMNFDQDMAGQAVRSGLRSIMFDVSSLNSRVYGEIYKRPGDLSEFSRIVKFLKGEGVKVGALVTVGAPGETRQTMAETVNKAFSMGFHDLHVRAMTPYPGTPLWTECEEKGLFFPKPDADDLLNDWGYIKTPEFTPSQVSWQRDWAESQLRTKRLMGNPADLVGKLGEIAYDTAFHPIIKLKQVYKYLTLMGGTPSHYKPPAPKAPPKAAEPAPDGVGSEPGSGRDEARPAAPAPFIPGATRGTAPEDRAEAPAPFIPGVVNPLRLAAFEERSDEEGKG